MFGSADVPRKSGDCESVIACDADRDEAASTLAYNKHDVSNFFMINLASSIICDILIVE